MYRTGDLLCHHTDVLYLVYSGELMVVFKNEMIRLDPGEFIIIPKGTSCKLASVKSAEVLIINQEGVNEPANLNTDKTKLRKI